jgi:putative acetyltransferase
MPFLIRAIHPRDLPAIEQVHLQAFPAPAEARLAALLHANGQASISLAASANDEIVGHILFSPVASDPPQPGLRAVGLAPLAVLPRCQRQGIGAALIHAGLEQCRAAGWHAVVVLGSPAYYGRFGFRRARDFGLGNEYKVDHEFMAMELTPGSLHGIEATVKYRPEFEEAGT